MRLFALQLIIELAYDILGMLKASLQVILHRKHFLLFLRFVEEFCNSFFGDSIIFLELIVLTKEGGQPFIFGDKNVEFFFEVWVILSALGDFLEQR